MKQPAFGLFALWALVSLAGAQDPGPVLIKEVASREYSLHVGGIQEPMVKEVVSREVSFYVENGHGDLVHEVVSREFSLVVVSTAAPPPVVELVLTPSPNGESVVLDWSGYNQWAVGDIDHFLVFLADTGAFSDVSAMTPVAVVPAGETGTSLSGLATWTDHYIAVVAVDALGNFNPLVTYSAAYVLSPEVISREVSLFVGAEADAPYREVVSRELSLVVVSSDPPPPIVDLRASAGPAGDWAALDWSGYNQWAVGDIDHFAVYLSDAGPITNVTGLVPYQTVPAGDTSVTLTGLAPNRDHYLAVVPVDALGQFDPEVNYAAAYVISPEVVSREFSIHVGAGRVNQYAEVVSREYSILMPDDVVPDPVTGLDSGFFAETSQSEFSAVYLDWTSYNEWAQRDVARYDIYVGPAFFDDVTGLTPFGSVRTGQQTHTLTGLPGGAILHFAVVAVDALGNFDPVVRSYSAKASIAGVGEVVNLSATGGPDRLSFTWEEPTETGGFLIGYRVHFDGRTVDLPATTTSWGTNGLDAASGYIFRVSTLDSFGKVSDGATVFAATWLPNPVNLELTELGGEVLMTWYPVAPGSLLAHYLVYEDTAPITNVSAMVPVSVVQGPSALLGDFAAVQGKHFAVVAVNLIGEFDPAVVSVEATKQLQTIDFPPLAAGPVIPLSATASSGLPVEFSFAPAGVGALVGAEFRPSAGGSVRFVASQPGDADYWPATAVQVLRIPPIITAFTASGVELEEGLVLDRDPTALRVSVSDLDGIARVEFFGKEPADAAWTPLHTDLVPGDGWGMDLDLSTLPFGAYELRAVVWTPTGHSAERVHSVVLEPDPVLVLSLDRATVAEGGTVSGRLVVDRPRPDDLLVSLTVSLPGQVDPGPPALIVAGQTAVTFTVTALDNDVIEADQAVVVRASAPGVMEVEAPLLVMDDDVPALTLSLNVAAVSEADGPSAAQGLVTVQPAPAAALTIWLVNSDPSAATVPTTLSLEANGTQIGFPVGAVDDPALDGAQTAEIQAEIRAGGQVVARSEVVTLAVGDDEGPTLDLEFERGWILEGGTETVIVRRVTGDLSAALDLQLAADRPMELGVAASVTIPAGTSEATVVVTGVDDGVADGSQTAVLTASAPGHAPAQIPVVVTDLQRPDLVVRNLASPARVDTEAYFEVGYRVANDGSGSTSLSILQRVFLSDDLVPGGDILLTQANLPGNLPPGVGFDRTMTVRAPREAGFYWLVVQADANGVEDEILESNNTVLHAELIEVVAAYSATVQTVVDLVPTDTPIEFTGAAWRGGQRMPFALVNIHIRVNGTERVIAALTDSTGRYTAIWRPLPGEGGNYEVGAVHPGVAEAPTQDQFGIMTLQVDFPSGTVAFDEGETVQVAGELRNPTDYDLTGLRLEVAPGLPAGLTVTPTLAATNLLAGAILPVTVEFQAAAGYSGGREVSLELSTAEGVSRTVSLFTSVRPLTPDLVITPNRLRCSVLRGGQKAASFTVENLGGAGSGPIDILLPDFPWMAHGSPATLDSIPPGGSADVTILLSPTANEDLTLYSGHLVVAPAAGASRNVPFEFRVVSDQRGDFEVTVVDEFYFFTAEAPKVTNAVVVLRDAITAEEIATARTGSNGVVTFADVLEGWYTVEVDSPDHTRWRANEFIDAGEVNQRQVFISRELVTYDWTVEEIEIEDRYRITVESTFEVNVPAPVVTVRPAVLEVGDLMLLGQSKVVNFTIENHGFIAAEAAALRSGGHPHYDITPLIEDIGLVPAMSFITIPVTVTRVGPDNKRAKGKSGVPCGAQINVTWEYFCGIRVPKFQVIPVNGIDADCGGEPWRPRGGPGGPGGPGSPSGSATAYASDPPSCLEICLLKGAIDCLIGFTPFGCANAAANCALQQDAWTCGTGATCWMGPGANAVVCVATGIKCFLDFGGGAKAASVPDKSSTGPWLDLMDQPTRDFVPDLAASLQGVEAALDYAAVLLGSRERVLRQADPDVSDWYDAFSSAQDPASEAGRMVTDNERAALTNVAATLGLDFAEFAPVVDRFNRTYAYADQGILRVEDVPAGESTDFIVWADVFTAASNVVAATAASQQRGFADPVEEFTATYEETREILLGNQGGVCAKVRVRIDQEAVMTRTAFRATLELGNNQEDAPLTDVGFQLDIRDAGGADASDVFNIRVTELSGLGAIDGTGTIAPASEGSAQWTLIPRNEAAPLIDTEYTIGGTITYVQGGRLFSVPVTAAPITVRPDAALTLKYFHQRDVYSDDPHTALIEPAIPYALAVMVENNGAGAARNLRIASAQPEIVDNEKGLLIDFSIIASQVAGQNLSPSLTADFGDVQPGERKIGTWLITSSLQGLFTDYEASFEHLDGFGDERLSLIQDVEIHEMIHMIEAQGSKADGLPDFLVNDVADIRDLPDTVHLSDGSTAPVAVHESAGAVPPQVSAGSLVVSLTVTNMGAGWGYLRIPDPGAGDFRLVRVERSDGRVLPLDRNVWTTDRTFIGLGRRAIYEDVLHLVDCDSTGSYTLSYEPVAQIVDTVPPDSAVAALPLQSGPLVPVAWSGSDDQALASFDIYVRVDGGAWTPWLERTPRTSSIYEGAVGSVYEFYSRARDSAGNLEAAPADADASTTVAQLNGAPAVMAVVDQQVAEGRTFSLQINATDAEDGDLPLHYEVDSAVEGIIIDEQGHLRWVTGEADGGSRVDVVVTVRDNGAPPAETAVAFSIEVTESNAAPVVAALGARTVRIGETLHVPVSATDLDLPAQTLSFTLAEAPSGMQIDPVSGLLSWTPPVTMVPTSLVAQVRVRDDGVPSAETVVPLLVQVEAAPGQPPAFEPIPLLIWISGVHTTVSFRASDPDGDPVTVSADVGVFEGARFTGAPGAGVGTLSWDARDTASGLYRMPLLATAGGAQVPALATLRVASSNAYWAWASAQLASETRPDMLEMLSDPDGDTIPNVVEMVYLLNPMQPDDFGIRMRPVAGDGQGGAVTLEFLRHAEAMDYVDIDVEQSSDMRVWSPWTGDPETSEDPDGDHDGDPRSRLVRLRLLLPNPNGVHAFRTQTRVRIVE